MNWFEPTRSFSSPFEPKNSSNMFTNYPFQVNALAQSLQRPSVQPQNIPHTLLAGPTKRVRHTQNNFTQITPKLEEFVQVPQVIHPSMRESVNNNVIVLHKAAEKDLVIPPLNGLSLMQLQQRRAENMIPHQQLVFQQLQRQQQSFNNLMQHQMAQQIEHQKLEFGQMMYRIQEAYRMQSATQEKLFANVPELQINHMQAQRMMNSQKLIELGGLSFAPFRAEKSPEVSVNDTTDFKASDEDDYQYVKLEEIKERSSDESTECQGSSRRSSAKTEEDKAMITQMVKKTLTKPEPKKKRVQSSKNYFAVFEENLTRKVRDGPRRKNKWQKIIGGPEAEAEQEQSEQPLAKMVVEQEAVEIVPVPQKVKPVRTPEVPQYLQDDSLIDYNAMLSTTITNDPAYVGTEDNAFVVIQKEATSSETRMGDRYQAVIPELRKKGEKAEKGVKARKRCPEVAWRPGCINENEMKKYYDDLCRILKCDEINEERALKLLKRKNFKKEKVKVNITKNEKFYASFLVVTNNMTLDNNDTIKEDSSQ